MDTRLKLSIFIKWNWYVIIISIILSKQEGCIMLFTYSCFNCRNEKGLLNFVSKRIKLVYRINTRYNIQKNKLPFKHLKPQFIGRILSNYISKYQLLFHWKSFGNIWSFILYLEAGETELINTCVVPFAMAEFGQRCLEAASTLKYEPLNSCITLHSVWVMKIFNVMLLNTCSRNKDAKIVKNQDGGLKVSLFDL